MEKLEEKKETPGDLPKCEPFDMDKPCKVKVAPFYETQSEGELLLISEPSTEQKSGTITSDDLQVVTKNEEKEASPYAVKKTGRAKRKEKKLRNEPRNITGGDGPCGVHVLDFAEARATEMCSMEKALSCKGGSKLTAQKLPRHMRRRAASHNVKRLPRRCRESAAREMEKSNASGNSNKKKRSRKQRRKTRDLQSLYAQRQRLNKWLETHLWHARRMKMCNKYGYSLSEHCSDKGVRAAYRSLTHGCLISDISYYGCVQLTGIQSHVIECLAPLFSSDTGLTIAGTAFLTGAREGKAILYRYGGYPLGALGPVQFLWQAPPPPLPGDTPLERSRVAAADIKPTSLWIWSHAAMHREVLSEVAACVRMYTSCSVGEGQKSVVDPLVTVRDMNSDLVRFRLIGPRSHALLMKALKPAFDSSSDKSEESGPNSMEFEIDPPSLPDVPRWWKGAIQENFDKHCQILSEAHPSIKSVSSPAQFQKGSVLSLTVLDPRLSTPSHKLDMVSQHYPFRKKGPFQVNGNKEKEDDAAHTSASCKMEVEETPSSSMSTLPEGVAYSSLWNPYIRAVVSNSKPETHVINQLRSRQLVRSSELELGENAARVPILLIQQTLGPTNYQKSGSWSLSRGEAVAGGWDIVLPRNWGREFWVSLVYHGARACGMNELHKCSQELQAQHFPDDFPDTPAAQAHHQEEKEKLLKKYSLSPPDKRRNYGKFLIASPFEYPWRELITVWSHESKVNRFCLQVSQPTKRIKLEDKPLDDSLDRDCTLGGGTARKRPLKCEEDSDVCSPIDPLFSSFYVLRCSEALASLAQFVDHLFSHKLSSNDLQYTFKTALQKFSIDKYLLNHRSALIGVRVQMYQRGTLLTHTVISIPHVSDFAPLVSPSRSHTYSGPKEDVNAKGMTLVEGNSLTVGISHLSKQQVSEVKEKRKLIEKLEKKLRGDGVEDTHCQSPLDSLLPSAVTDFKLHPVRPSRETFGYTTSAGYRHTTSLYSGVGFCTFAGFLEALYNSYLAAGVGEPLALVRGYDTHYWFVRLALA